MVCIRSVIHYCIEYTPLHNTQKDENRLRQVLHTYSYRGGAASSPLLRGCPIVRVTSVRHARTPDDAAAGEDYSCTPYVLWVGPASYDGNGLCRPCPITNLSPDTPSTMGGNASLSPPLSWSSLKRPDAAFLGSPPVAGRLRIQVGVNRCRACPTRSNGTLGTAGKKPGCLRKGKPSA